MTQKVMIMNLLILFMRFLLIIFIIHKTINQQFISESIDTIPGYSVGV